MPPGAGRPSRRLAGGAPGLLRRPRRRWRRRRVDRAPVRRHTRRHAPLSPTAGRHARLGPPYGTARAARPRGPRGRRARMPPDTTAGDTPRTSPSAAPSPPPGRPAARPACRGPPHLAARSPSESYRPSPTTPGGHHARPAPGTPTPSRPPRPRRCEMAPTLPSLPTPSRPLLPLRPCPCLVPPGIGAPAQSRSGGIGPGGVGPDGHPIRGNRPDGISPAESDAPSESGTPLDVTCPCRHSVTWRTPQRNLAPPR